MNKEIKLQVAGFLDNSLVNGKGMRSVVFVSGCSHNCKNCQNKTMQDYSYGDNVTVYDVLERIKSNIPIITGVTFSGGEPFDQAEALSELAAEIKKLGLNIWSYTGYTYEEILKSGDKNKLKLLRKIDTLVDGPFIEELKEGAPKYMGSTNQRIVKVKDILHF